VTIAETGAGTNIAPPETRSGAPAAVGEQEVSAGRRILGNFLALSAVRPLTWLSTIGLTILLPRYLGDVNLGKVNFAFAFADWCGLLASFGIATYLAKEVAQRREAASSIVLNAVTLRFALAVVIGGIAVVVASLLGYDPLTRSLVYLLTAHMLLTVFLGVLIGALQGIQQLRVVALVDAVMKVMQVALIAVVLLRGHGAVAVAVAYIVADVIAVVWLLLSVHRRIGFKGPVTWRAWGSILRGGMPFLVWETALLTYARVDVIILAVFAHDAVLGWYGAAYKIISIPLFIPAVLLTVVFPALAAAANNPELFNRMARRAVLVVMLTTVPMAFGLMALTGNIIDLFGYPVEFTNSIMPTVLLAASLPLVGLNMIVGAILSARDQQKQWAIAGVIAAALNVSLNLIAIPYTQNHFDNGAIGAALVTSLTEVLLLVAGQVLLRRGILDRHTYVASAKCLLIGIAMGVLVWLARDLPIVVTVPLGAGFYALGVLVLGVLSRDDMAQIRALLSRRTASASEPVGADSA
jgi:O-antigen/teichoic acid export membrane protein